MVYGLWSEDDSGLLTGPLTITKTLLKHFFDSLDSWTHSCPLSLATQTLKTFLDNVSLELGGQIPLSLFGASALYWDLALGLSISFLY